jgi:hypothetical protein
MHITKTDSSLYVNDAVLPLAFELGATPSRDASTLHQDMMGTQIPLLTDVLTVFGCPSSFGSFAVTPPTIAWSAPI